MNDPPSKIEEQGGFGKTGERKVFPCESCGASLTFSIGAQRLKCEHCGFEKDLEFAADATVSEHDLEATLQRLAQRQAQSTSASMQQELTCKGCGAIVVFEGSLTSSKCAYCDTPLQVKDAHQTQHPIAVDGVCTFLVDEKVAKDSVKQWVASRWFAPGEFKKRGVDGKVDGVYMPFFTFDAMTFTRYTGERGDAYYVDVGEGQNKRRERRVNWSFATGAFQRFFDDVCVPALQSLPPKLLQGLEPWPTEKLIPFTAAALAGKRAHTYERSLNDSFDLAKRRIHDELSRDVRRRIGGDEQRVHSQDTQYSALSFKHVLLPVWILAYRYNNTPYRVIVNAVTGTVHGERPWSAIKIALAVIAGLIAVAIFVSLGNAEPR